MDGRSRLCIPSPDDRARLERLADLARTRADALRLYHLCPSPSLLARIDAADHVLVRVYAELCHAGLGDAGVALLRVHAASHIALAAARRAA